MKHLTTILAVMLGTALALPQSVAPGNKKIDDPHENWCKNLDFSHTGTAPPGCHNGMNWRQFRKPKWESETSEDT
jgi:hypothetical protein